MFTDLQIHFDSNSSYSFLVCFGSVFLAVDFEGNLFTFKDFTCTVYQFGTEFSGFAFLFRDVFSRQHFFNGNLIGYLNFAVACCYSVFFSRQFNSQFGITVFICFNFIGLAVYLEGYSLTCTDRSCIIRIESDLLV